MTDPSRWGNRCENVRSFDTMRDAREAAQTQPARTPYRCSRCRLWHLDGHEVRDRRFRVRIAT